MDFCGCAMPRKSDKKIYNKLDIIYNGTFSTIWKCENNGNIYCMKIANHRGNDHVENEINVLKKLNHEGIVKYYDSYIDSDGKYVLIEEYVDGHDLYDYMSNYHPEGIPDNVANILFPQMCKILKYIHGMGYIHCDIKLENFLIKDNVIKLCDFGLTCNIDHKLKDRQIIRGSENYIAPESYNMIGIYPETDIWSLGITFYTMI